MTVNIYLETGLNADQEEFFRSIAEKTMKLMDLKDYDVSFIVTTNEKIKELNRDYLNHDRPTDVITFLMDEFDPESGNRYLGDVVISAEMAQEQADELGHSFKKELSVLIIHGILHLAGYEDEEKTKRKEMMALQDNILEKVFNEK